tara:strand:+ start:73 stop:987 length:915 start_codon:yes stop_codon:yes gene_type:complete
VAFFIPIVIAGARFLIPAAAKAAIKQLVKTSGPKAAQTAAKKIAQTVKQKRPEITSDSTVRKLTSKELEKVKTGVDKFKAGQKPSASKITSDSTVRKLTSKELKKVKKGVDKFKAGRKPSSNLKKAIGPTAGISTLIALASPETSMDTSKSGSKKQTSDNKTKTFGEAFAAARKEKGAGKTFMYKGKKYTTDRADDKPKVTEKKNFGSMDGSTSDPKTMTKRPPAKKKRDRLFGLKSMPKIDSKEGGDKVNLPFGLGSYETLPQEEETSMNKKGGSIKRKNGSSLGCGKALRGQGKGPYKKKGM